MVNGEQAELRMMGRQALTVGGVKGVDSFEGDRITADSQLGNLILRGRNLKITQLNLEEGILSVEGWIAAVEYQDDRKEIHQEGLRQFFKKWLK